MILTKGNEGGSKMRALRLQKLSIAITTIMSAKCGLLFWKKKTSTASGLNQKSL